VVHKKYIRKNGRVYGPYLYENKRVNGKVVTRYLGIAGRNSSGKNRMPFWLWIVLGFFVVILLSFFMFKNFSSTGRVSLAIGEHYLYGEQITGNLKLNLKAGELVPRDSKVIVSVGNQVNEILLSDLISEGSVKGDYYAAGTSLSGTGEGYGIEGSRLVYPTIDFELLISRGLSEDKEKDEEEKENAEAGVEIIASPSHSPTESLAQPSPSESASPSQSVTEPSSSPESSPIPSESVSEKSQPSESQNEKKSEEVKEKKKSEIEKNEDKKLETTIESTTGTDKGTSSEASSEVTESSDGQTVGETSITGSAVRENEFVVQGKVSKGNDFRYVLESRETAAVVDGSVKLNGGFVGDDKISLKGKDGTIVVSTDYGIVESGFGADYKGDGILELEIDFDRLNVRAVGEKFRISVVYNNVEIVSAEKTVSITAFVNETLQNKTEREIIINETNVTVPELNISRNVSFVRDISDFRIQKDSYFVVNLSNYFDGAEKYDLNMENISASYNDSIMRLIPDSGFTGTRKGRISAYAGSDGVVSNEFNILVSAGNFSIITYRKKIIVGEPVVWRMNVSLAKPENISLELPGESRNIVVKKIVEGAESEAGATITGRAISGRVSAYVDLSNEPRIIRWLKRLFSVFTGKVVSDIVDTNLTSVEVKLNDDAVDYIIEYVTDGPKAHEENNNRGKIVVISGPDDLNYTDIIERLDISNKGISIWNISKIKVYWHNYYPDNINVKQVHEVDEEDLVEEISDDKFITIFNNETSEVFVGITGRAIGEEREVLDIGNESFNAEARYIKQEVPFVYNDTNGDGFIDYIEWVVPHLSSQTFEIILVSKAEHLDENRTFIEDVYDLVKARDNNWTSPIPSEHYIRVVFEKNLTSDKDITLYARSNETNASIKVYERDENISIADFGLISEDKEYKVYLTNLNKSQDTFDLKIVTGSIAFDYIVDPTLNVGQVNQTASVKNNITVENYPLSHITLNDSSILLYMPFDVPNRSTTEYDYSADNNDGTLTGNIVVNGSGFIGGGARYPGIGAAYISLGERPELRTLANFTVMAWVYSTNDSKAIKGIAKHGLQFGSYNWEVFHDAREISGRPFIEFTVGGTILDTASNSAPLQQWFHSACTVNNTNTMKCFINGQQSGGTATAGSTTVGGNLTLIGARNTNQFYFNGTLDEIMFFNRSLNSSEILSIFNNQSYRYITPASQLFVNASLSQNNTLNRVNISTNSTILLSTNISLRLRELNASNDWAANTSWQNITNGSDIISTFNVSTNTRNVTLEFDFLSSRNESTYRNFYSPILRDNIILTSWEETVTGANVAPTNPSPEINSTNGLNRTLEDLNCFDSIIDPDGGRLNVTVQWYRNVTLNFSIDFNNSYANNSFFYAILDDANTTKGENWTCGMRLYDGTTYSTWVNATGNVTVNNSLPIAILSSPASGNITINRTPTFSWGYNDNDITDNSSLQFELNLTCFFSPSGTCTTGNRYISRTALNSTTSHTVGSFLEFLVDNNYYYNWTARAWDGDSFGSWTAYRNISIQSEVSISLPTASVSFGNMNVSQNRNTSTSNPAPLVLRNDGNALTNISVNFTSLFVSSASPTNNFQYLIRNTTKNCFVSTGTQTTFTSAPTSTTRAIHQFNFTLGYQPDCNNVSIDFNVTVPSDESPGNKSSLVTFIASLGEPGYGSV